MAALVVATLSASAQGAFIKPMAGGTLATLTGDVSDDLKLKLGFVGGAEFGYQFNDHFALTAGALYSMQGAKFDSEHTKYNINLDYLNVPIMLAVYPVKEFGIKAGIQYGFLLKAKEGDDNLKDFYNKKDFSIPVGISYEFEETSVDLRYNFDLSNIVNDDAPFKGGFTNAVSTPKIHNAIITLTIGYKIPLY